MVAGRLALPSALLNCSSRVIYVFPYSVRVGVRLGAILRLSSARCPFILFNVATACGIVVTGLPSLSSSRTRRTDLLPVSGSVRVNWP